MELGVLRLVISVDAGSYDVGEELFVDAVVMGSVKSRDSLWAAGITYANVREENNRLVAKIIHMATFERPVYRCGTHDAAARYLNEKETAAASSFKPLLKRKACISRLRLSCISNHCADGV